MFIKKITSIILSAGILSLCCMSALASTVSGSGNSINGSSGSRNINYSITSEYGERPILTSEMNFYNPLGCHVECYIENTKYMVGLESEPLIPWKTSGSDMYQYGPYRAFCQQCKLVDKIPTPDRMYKSIATFHYDSSVFGSFVGSLEKVGFDA